MIGQTIGFVFRSLPAFPFIVAIVAAACRRSGQAPAERNLSWLLDMICPLLAISLLIAAMRHRAAR
jgi:hypothetical protein